MVDTRKDLHVFPGVKATLVSSSNQVSSSHRTLAFLPFILKTKPVKSSVVAYVSSSCWCVEHGAFLHVGVDWSRGI